MTIKRIAPGYYETSCGHIISMVDRREFGRSGVIWYVIPPGRQAVTDSYPTLWQAKQAIEDAAR